MIPTAARLGGGARYAYPKEVWSPAGGWWTRPANWKSSTAIVGLAVSLTTYGIWAYSAGREVRHNAPTREIPSMLWSNQAAKMGVKDESSLAGQGGSHDH
ncbi:BQ5605_C001g00890 [Microbotryum silenes-dioicae]|uniref:BQ5605_C001g00890 protein n=1 Tax=Microbotryum silenes-dioicae TaxID=796604 RepID=A0A2X0M4J8_9BASI|nr:BQ5605_C001g00890 [Microbotryum silenes-dioicae]